MATKHRAYENDLPSVTTILNVLRKEGLERWFKKNTMQYCDTMSARGKLIGTQIHSAIENFILKQEVKVETEYVDEVTNALKSFMLFHKEHPEIELEWSEIKLTSLLYGYNGTMDCRAKRTENRILLDWKSGECKERDKPPIYDESKAQAAAYVNADNEINNSGIENALVVYFAKDKVAYNIYEMGKEEIKDQFNEIFLPALKIYNYQRRMKNGIQYGHE